MSSEKIKDGGPAFPTPNDGFDGMTYGMSLRDWFAGAYSFGIDGISQTWAEKIMGEKCPDWSLDDGLACVRWWAEAEARVRYLHADAMLKAREAQS